jgi:hypothetical protein
MNPTPGPDGVSRALDAVVFSPHKFVGGPSASGVLVVKRSVIRSPVPTQPGALHAAQAARGSLVVRHVCVCVCVRVCGQAVGLLARLVVCDWSLECEACR